MINIVSKYVVIGRREKALLLSAAVLLTPLLLLRFVFVPLHDYRVERRGEIFELERKIELLDALGQELRYYDRRGSKNVQALDKLIDKILRQTNLLEKSKVSAEDRAGAFQKLNLTLNAINLSELTSIVHAIEHRRPVVLIDTLDMGPSYQSPKLFRVALSLSSE